MTEDQAQDVPGSDNATDSGAKKRPPPTIDLEASDVSGETQATAGASSRWSWFRVATILPPLAGALAALVVVGILWAAGVIGPQQDAAVSPQVATGLNDLSNRIGKVETRLSSAPAKSDGDLRARVDALESAANTLHDQASALRRQIDATAATLNELKAAPRDGASPDVSALTDRVARLEQTVRTLPDKPQAPAQASDDVRPRRLVIATVLETKVRRGEPYAAALAAAKAVAEDKSALAPLDAGAETGVPTEAMLAKDLLAQLAQPAPQASSQPPAEQEIKASGLLGKLASNLVKVERVDAPESEPADAKLQAIAALARQNDVRRARDAVEKLPPDLKARLQPWLDRVSARDVALKTAAAFTSSTLAAMSKTD